MACSISCSTCCKIWFWTYSEARLASCRQSRPCPSYECACCTENVQQIAFTIGAPEARSENRFLEQRLNDSLRLRLGRFDFLECTHNWPTAWFFRNATLRSTVILLLLRNAGPCLKQTNLRLFFLHLTFRCSHCATSTTWASSPSFATRYSSSCAKRRLRSPGCICITMHWPRWRRGCS